MAKAEWVELSQNSGSGDAAVAVSSKQAYTGREARTSIITWVAEDVEPIERTVIQEGAEVNTTLKGGNSITTMIARVLILGESNEAGLGFRKGAGEVPYDIDAELNVAGLKVIRKDGEMTMIPGDPGARQKYNFSIGLTLRPDEILPPLGTTHRSSLVIDGASGKSVIVRINYNTEEKKFIIVPEGDIVIDALGTPVTIQVESNTNWVIE
jgi:hypothetical protein